MSPPEPVKDSPTNLPSSPVLPARIHHCHWDWCRLTFSTDALLIDHVICEHVRTAQPVRRRDLPMLQRAEEGLGDSLSLGMDGILSSNNMQPMFPLRSKIRRSPLPPTQSTRPIKRARIEPPSPLLPESHRESQADRHTDPDADLLQPTPPTPPTSHAPSTPPPGSRSRVHTGHISTPSPESSSSPERKSFAQLSSPDSSSSISGSLPVTPSFDSQIARAIRGLGTLPRAGSVNERVISRVSSGFDSDSSANSSPGTNSGASQKSVERELTQRSGRYSDSDFDGMDANAEVKPDFSAEEDAALAKIAIPNLQSNENENIRSSSAMGQGQGQMEADTELERPDDPKKQKLPRDHQLQEQGTPRDVSQPTSKQPPAYRVLSPIPRERTPQWTGLQNHTRTPVQRQSHQTSPTKSFRSGSLKVSPMNKPANLLPLSTRFVVESRNGDGAGTSGQRHETDEPISQATSQSQQNSQPLSQESQRSWFSGSYGQPFYQLQTQAPYESQGFSQSDTSTGT